MEHIVGVADMKITNDPQEVLVTHALGSGLGIAVHDPVALVGGLLHVVLPRADSNSAESQANPCQFIDLGVPRFLQMLYQAGACRQRLVVKVAGAATLSGAAGDGLDVGRHNIMALRKLLWRNDVLLAGEEVGGTVTRTMRLEMDTGKVWVRTQGQEIEV